MILYLYATYLTSHVKLMQIFKVRQLQDSTWSLRYTFLLKSLSEKEPLQIFNHPSSVRASQAKPLPNRDFSLLLLHLKEEGKAFLLLLQPSAAPRNITPVLVVSKESRCSTLITTQKQSNLGASRERALSYQWVWSDPKLLKDQSSDLKKKIIRGQRYN